MKLRLRLLLSQLNHIHLVQLLLAGHGHISGGNSGLISGHEILKLRNLLLLSLVGRLQLGLLHLVDLPELVVISHIPVKSLILHVVDNVDYAV